MSFVSHETDILDLALLGSDICICFTRSSFKGKITKKFVNFLKLIFERSNIEKCGKDILFLMVLLFKNFGVMSTNCYNYDKVTLKQRPMNIEVGNPVLSLIANAMAVRQTLSENLPSSTRTDGPLEISNENMTVVNYLCEKSLEIDDNREEYNMAQWRCRFVSVFMDESGNELKVVPKPARYKLRRGSTTRVQTHARAHQGSVESISKTGTAKVYMDSSMGDDDIVEAIDVERYNELNIRLKETTRYGAEYLSKERTDLNPFQKMLLLHSHEELPKEPLVTTSRTFFEQSGLKLNDSQKEAVRNSTHAVSFVVGPPGTGESTVITAIVGEALASGKGVIVLGQTNSSVNQVYNSLLENRICGGDSMTLLVGYEHFQENKNAYNQPFYNHSNVCGHKQVLLCTLSMAKKISQLMLMQFRDSNGQFVNREIAIFDEGGRISTLCFSEILPYFDAIKRLVVCGDRRQGQPFSKKQRKLESLIMMLENHALYQKGIIKKAFLNRQYRMEFDIAELVSSTFYKGRIVSENKGGRDNLFCHFVSGMCYDNNKSLCCENEADLVLRYGNIIQKKHWNSKVVILCYYYGQIMLIREMMELRYSTRRRLQVCSVDSFQGMEADYVILSTCAQKSRMSPHVADKERACVAMSRGKRRLIILGNKRTLQSNDLWAGMLKAMTTFTGNCLSVVAIR